MHNLHVNITFWEQTIQLIERTSHEKSREISFASVDSAYQSAVAVPSVTILC